MDELICCIRFLRCSTLVRCAKSRAFDHAGTPAPAELSKIVYDRRVCVQPPVTPQGGCSAQWISVEWTRRLARRPFMLSS
jgi:hypothetical protein